MKIAKFFTFSLLLIFIIVVCTAAKPEKCGKCHSDSAGYKEWQESGHANALKTLMDAPNAQQSCLKCHSADYGLVWKNTWMSMRELPKLKDANNSVSCSSCHKHGVKNEKNLVLPARRLCTSCHVLYCGG